MTTKKVLGSGRVIIEEVKRAVHQDAVSFRNKKREQYLKGNLSKEDMRFVEEMDVERTKEGLRRIPRLNYEEPLACDVFMNVMERGSFIGEIAESIDSVREQRELKKIQGGEW